MKEYIAQRSKAFAGGLAAALTASVIQHFEVSFGIDLPSEIELAANAGVAGFVTYLATYWAPANKPMN